MSTAALEVSEPLTCVGSEVAVRHSTRPKPRSLHAGDEGRRQPARGVEVEAECLVPLLLGGVEVEGPGLAQVVDDDVHAAELRP